MTFFRKPEMLEINSISSRWDASYVLGEGQAVNLLIANRQQIMFSKNSWKSYERHPAARRNN